jgi:peptidyl-prolyl cis-trans isomerase A (cyclophilin A)
VANLPRMRKTLSTLIAAALLAPAAPRAGEPAPRKPASKAEATKATETWALFVTSRGKIAARLLPDEAPVAVKNFVDLATGKKEWHDPKSNKPTTEKLYDGTLLHRVIPGFMIQGGDPMSRGAAMLSGPPVQADNRFGMYGPGYRFDDEIQAGQRPFDQPCQLAYANSGPNSNGSQFFITEVPVGHLNPSPCPTCKAGVKGYVRFGVGTCGCERVRPIAVAGGSQTRLEKVLIVHQKPSCD